MPPRGPTRGNQNADPERPCRPAHPDELEANDPPDAATGAREPANPQSCAESDRVGAEHAADSPALAWSPIQSPGRLLRAHGSDRPKSPRTAGAACDAGASCSIEPNAHRHDGRSRPLNEDVLSEMRVAVAVDRQRHRLGEVEHLMLWVEAA